MYRKALVMLIVITILFASFTGVRVNAESDLTTKLKEALIPLKTVEAENGFEDLMPMKEILKDKKIIGMGEATHGTREFFQMKHRMFEFLVEEMGYRSFAIEAEFGGAQRVNDYIVNGRGSITKSLDSMKFWTWNTEEVAEMIEWMKEYNLNASDENKIRFYGFDMQSIDNSVDYILYYLVKVGSSNASLYKRNLIGSKTKFYHPDKSTIMSFNSNIEIIHSDLVKNKDTYIKKASEEEYDRALQHIAVINQWVDYESNGTKFETRDYYMAENVKWILDHENKHYGNDKIMLWAHNGHIANSDSNNKVMGKNLRDAYKEEYYSLGFDFYQGNFVSMPMTFYGKVIGDRLASFYISSSPFRSYADEMEKTGIPISYLDFGSAEQDEEILEFISTKLHVNSIGAAHNGKLYSINAYSRIVVKDTFDGMIFVKSTTEAKRAKPYVGGLPDGDKLLSSHYTRLSIFVIIILIFSYIVYRKKRSTFESGKFYILGREKEEAADINPLERKVIKINNYLNSFSPFKYCIIVSIIITIINMMLIKVNSLTAPHSMYLGTGVVGILMLFLFIVLGAIEMLLVYIIPLNIVKALSKDKTIYLKHLIVVSIIMSIINTQNFFSSGILIYSISLFLSCIYGLLCTYTYGLLYYRREKPIIRLFLISAISNVLIMLGVILGL